MRSILFHVHIRKTHTHIQNRRCTARTFLSFFSCRLSFANAAHLSTFFSWHHSSEDWCYFLLCSPSVSITPVWIFCDRSQRLIELVRKRKSLTSFLPETLLEQYQLLLVVSVVRLL